MKFGYHLLLECSLIFLALTCVSPVDGFTTSSTITTTASGTTGCVVLGRGCDPGAVSATRRSVSIYTSIDTDGWAIVHLTAVSPKNFIYFVFVTSSHWFMFIVLLKTSSSF
jgi:hypothetical protein